MSGFEFLPESAHAAGVRVVPGCNAQHGFEGPLQVEWTLSEPGAQLRQRDRLVQVLLNIPADRFDQLLTRVSADGLGTAAQALAKACALGFARLAKEDHVLTAGPLRRARRTAVNARRGNAEDETAVTGAVASHHCLPPLIFGQGRHFQLCPALRGEV